MNWISSDLRRRRSEDIQRSSAVVASCPSLCVCLSVNQSLCVFGCLSVYLWDLRFLIRFRLLFSPRLSLYVYLSVSVVSPRPSSLSRFRLPFHLSLHLSLSSLPS